jgi:hypothetical protein
MALSMASAPRGGARRSATGIARGAATRALERSSWRYLLALYSLPRDHWTKLRSTNPLERMNREIGSRSDVVGIYPNDAARRSSATPHPGT